MTAEERSEALIEAIQDGDQDQLVESWMAEVRADERRRTAEEIKQRAEAVLDTDHLWVIGTNSLADAFTAGVKHAVRICDEIGGSDE